ncbi:hypothetical protein HK096_002308, partial [Nowakowskiella sp. JEL0078]
MQIVDLKPQGDAAAWPVQGLIRSFRPDIEKRIHEFQQRKSTEKVMEQIEDEADQLMSSFVDFNGSQDMSDLAQSFEFDFSSSLTSSEINDFLSSSTPPTTATTPDSTLNSNPSASPSPSLDLNANCTPRSTFILNQVETSHFPFISNFSMEQSVPNNPFLFPGYNPAQINPFDPILLNFPQASINSFLPPFPKAPFQQELYATPPPSADVSALLTSSTAVTCQKLLNEPAKRKPGRKRKTDLPDQKQIDLTEVTVVKLEDSATRPTPTPTPQPAKVAIYPIGHNQNYPVTTIAIDTHANSATSALAKRQERLIKNREAADQSRKRKREHLQMLETHAQKLIAENEVLRIRVLELESQAVSLTEENTRLKTRLSDLGLADDMKMDVNANGKRARVENDGKPGPKAVSAVFMVFLFTFAIFLFPSQRPLTFDRQKIAFGISDSPHEESSRVFDLIGPSNKDSFLFNSRPPVAEPSPTESGKSSFEFDWTSLETSSINVPVTNISDFLSVLTSEQKFSKESRKQITQLQQLLAYSLSLEKTRRGNEVIINPIKIDKIDNQVIQILPEKPSYFGESEELQDLTSEPTAVSPSPPLPCLSMSNLMRLVPYTDTESIMRGASDNDICTCNAGDMQTRISLLTVLEATDPSMSTDVSQFESIDNAVIRIDFQVVGASLVRYGTTKKEVPSEDVIESRVVLESARRVLRERRSAERKARRLRERRGDVEEVGEG